MRDPVRLKDTGDAFERQVLRAARNEQPRTGAHQRTLAALGLGGAVVAASAAAAGTAAAGTAAAGSTVAAGSSTALIGGNSAGLVGACLGTSSKVVGATVGPLVVGKWLAAGLLIGAATVSAAHQLPSWVSPGPTEMPAVTHGTKDSASARLKKAAPRSPGSDRRVPAAHPEEALPPQRPVPAGITSKGGAPTTVASEPGRGTDPLPEEVKLIDAARSALTLKNGSGAQQLLDNYDQRFPRGILRPEAEVLRLKAKALIPGTPSAHQRAFPPPPATPNEKDSADSVETNSAQ